jgi:uncharacterized protein
MEIRRRLPVAWTLAAGSRLRISISGADEQHYPQVPHGRPPRLTFATGGHDGTRFAIPLREGQGFPASGRLSGL